MSAQPSLWTAYLGLGANMAWEGSPPEQTLQLAARTLGELGEVLSGSSLWRTAPVGPVAEQPSFTNAVLALRTRLEPQVLLTKLLQLEQCFGRVRGPVTNGPRTLDLDLLLLETWPESGADPEPVCLQTQTLTLPHPLLHCRRFVLAPLAEIAPNLRHPTLGQSVADLLQALPNQPAQRLPVPLLSPAYSSFKPGSAAGAIVLLLACAAAASAQTAQTRPPTPKPAPTETVQVLAYRSPVAALESPVSTRVLTAKTLQQAAPVALDGKLRTIPGFDLFRRSSSLVANPTTEGVSLRGLGSTAASRTLVLLGDEPLNDPYGGWIHWDELPTLVVERVEVVRGGVSDLYGSSAVGGVVQVTPVGAGSSSPGKPVLTLQSGYGAEALNDNQAKLRGGWQRWSGVAAAGVLATDGYILVAPALRGPVDTRSNVHAQSGFLFGERALGTLGSGDGLWLRGNVLNESRQNGTIDTGNTTRLWRYAAGLDRFGFGGQWQARAWGSTERFVQGFSSVGPGRRTATLTRTATDPANELGGALRWQRSFMPELVALAGGDVRDVRAQDIERPTARGAPQTSTTARQTDGGGYGELLWTPGPWLLSASARLDHFSNRDAATYTLQTGARQALPDIEQTVANPRLGVSRRLSAHLAVSASAFRAYRAPTENELYRTGQVGQQTTLANPNLRSERATGWETGVSGELPASRAASWRASYFWTEVNRPITALTLQTTPTATTRMRENLGQIRSRGLSLDGSIHPTAWLTATGGYQFARATVTRFQPQPSLVGLWIPQVPRNTGTLQLTAQQPRLGLLSLQVRTSGRQYDDDANSFILHPFTRFDLYAARDFGQRWQVFAAVENLLDRSIDVGRTPIRTLGGPQQARFGLRLTLGSGS